MGLIYTDLELSNPRNKQLLPVKVRALADSGALHLCIPEHVAVQLALEPLYQREVTTADGKKHLCPYVGPIQLRFENRACFTGALIFGDEALLGAVPMEDMDILLHPATQRVIVNPQSPNIPTSVAKSFIPTQSSLVVCWRCHKQRG